MGTTTRTIRAGLVWLLLPVAVLLAGACDTSWEGQKAPLRVLLQNNTSSPAQLWIGHDSEPLAGSRVEPSRFTAQNVEVEVAVKQGSFVEGKDKCQQEYPAGNDSLCRFQDSLRINAMQDGKKTTESVRLEWTDPNGGSVTDYKTSVTIHWDGTHFAIR